MPVTRITRAFALLLMALCAFAVAAPTGTATVRQTEPVYEDPCDDPELAEDCAEEEEPLTPEEQVGDYYDATVGPAVFAVLERTFARTLTGAKPKISTEAFGPFYVPTDVFVRLRAKKSAGGFTAATAAVDLATDPDTLDFSLTKKAGKALQNNGKLKVTAELDLDDPTFGAVWGDDIALTLKGVKK